MIATHRVKDSSSNTIGFIIDGTFYTDYTVKNNIDIIDNLKILKSGTIRAKKKLLDVDYRKTIIKQEYKRIVKENPFVRDIQKELKDWKKDTLHKVLNIRGSRQIGKTTELLKFAYSNYEYVIYVDLSEDRYNFKEVVSNGATQIEFEKYCRRALLPHFINNRNTILIIDEIQESKAVFNSIRLMHSTINCDIVVTGSYLGRIIGNKDYFLPAGTMTSLDMLPLSFTEFCRIFNQEKTLLTIDLYGNSNDADYEKLNKLYSIYRKIGGYPEVISKFITTKDINKCYNVIEQLLITFKEESRHYFNSIRDVEIFDQVYRSALSEMCKERKGTGKHIIETITSITKNNTDLLVNKSEISNAIVWIQYAGIIGLCNLANDGDLRNIIPGRRIYFMDCGIASYLCENSALDKSSLEGILTETFVYTELHRLFNASFSTRKVIENEVCFAVNGNHELDFILADKDRIIYGIEVKTSSGEPKSLKIFIDKRLINKGIVAKPTKGGHGDKFDTIPIYTVGCRFPYK